MNYIWATRGRTWGFRFLRDGGLSDPLPTYTRAFTGYDGTFDLFAQVDDMLVLRFPDPEGRKDRAGRTIPHEFVVLDHPLAAIEDFEAGRELLWKLVEPDYLQAYESSDPPGM